MLGNNYWLLLKWIHWFINWEKCRSLSSYSLDQCGKCRSRQSYLFVEISIIFTHSDGLEKILFKSKSCVEKSKIFWLIVGGFCMSFVTSPMSFISLFISSTKSGTPPPPPLTMSVIWWHQSVLVLGMYTWTIYCGISRNWFTKYVKLFYFWNKLQVTLKRTVRQ